MFFIVRIWNNAVEFVIEGQKYYLGNHTPVAYAGTQYPTGETTTADGANCIEFKILTDYGMSGRTLSRNVENELDGPSNCFRHAFKLLQGAGAKEVGVSNPWNLTWDADKLAKYCNEICQMSSGITLAGLKNEFLAGSKEFN